MFMNTVNMERLKLDTNLSQMSHSIYDPNTARPEITVKMMNSSRVSSYDCDMSNDPATNSMYVLDKQVEKTLKLHVNKIQDWNT